MRSGRRRGGAPGERRAVRAAGVGVDARRGARRGARAPGWSTARAASTTRRSTTRRSSCRWAGGRSRGSGPGTGPTGSASTPPARRSSSRRRPRRRADPLLPVQRRGGAAGGRGGAVHGHERAADRRQRRTLTTLCDTFVPSIEVDDDPHGFWARAASHLAVPEAIEQALAQLPAKQVEGLGELLDALAAEGLNEAPPDARGDRPRVRRLGARGAGGDPR